MSSLSSYFAILFTITFILTTVNVRGQSLDNSGDVESYEEPNVSNSRSQSRPDSRLLRATPSQSSSNFHVDVHTHPKTAFSCAGKQAGEYYADVDAKCAIYYVCTGAPGALVPISFACPNGTLFNQANKVCAQEEMVFCGLATRWYESVRGVIDSKGKDPRDVTTNNVRIGSQPVWNHVEESVLNLRAPTRERQPAATAPRVAAAEIQNEPVRNVPLRPSFPSSRPQTISRQQTQPVQPQTNSRILPAHQSLVTRSRPQNNNPLASSQLRAQPQTSTTPKPTTTTQAPKLSNDYEYVDYEQIPPGSVNLKQSEPSMSQSEGIKPESGSESRSEGSNSRTKRSPKRRKGKLLGFPSDFLTRSTNSTVNASSDFSCHDKVSTLAYADIASNCTKFHLCVEIKKGKMSDNILYCQAGHGYSQEAAACLPLGSFDCTNSHKYFVLDKSKTGQGKTWKLPIAWTKKSLFSKN